MKFSVPGFGFGERDQLIDVLHRQIRRHDQHQRHRRDLADPGKILDRVDGQAFVEGADDRVSVGGRHQGVAVGRAVRDADRAGDAGPVLDDDRLLPQQAEFVGERAGREGR